MGYLTLIIIILMIFTLSVVVIGVAQLTGKNKVDKKTQNKLMALRVALQTIIVVLIGIIYYFSNK